MYTKLAHLNHCRVQTCHQTVYSALWWVCSSCAFNKHSLRAISTEIETNFEYSQLLTHLGDLLPIVVIEMKVEHVFP